MRHGFHVFDQKDVTARVQDWLYTLLWLGYTLHFPSKRLAVAAMQYCLLPNSPPGSCLPESARSYDWSPTQSRSYATAPSSVSHSYREPPSPLITFSEVIFPCEHDSHVSHQALACDEFDNSYLSKIRCHVREADNILDRRLRSKQKP